MICRQIFLWIFVFSLTKNFVHTQNNRTVEEPLNEPLEEPLKEPLKKTLKESHKDGKVFSLFSIVTFSNTGCKSQSTMSSGQSTLRNGTCYASSECTNKGGTASGNCASGFGVCCIFLVSTSGSTINQNCTYLRNPGFPSSYTATSGLTYTVQKCSTDVCYLRLDFETFNIVGPTVSTEFAAAQTTVGLECADSFKVTTNVGNLASATQGQNIPIICGTNTGQHIYVDIGTQSTDTVTLNFAFATTTSTVRSWEIKVSQITCSNPNRPPNGCLQYYTTLQGRMTTFNFYTTSATSRHLDNQQYNICIRKSQGYCCVQYWTCEGVPNAFSLDSTLTTVIVATIATATFGAVDLACDMDYVIIPGSSSSCTSVNQKLFTKYCGQYLAINNVAGAIFSAPICDCTGSFQVGIRTDSLVDTPAQTGAFVNRGVCLDFMQVPCVTN